MRVVVGFREEHFLRKGRPMKLVVGYWKNIPLSFLRGAWHWKNGYHALHTTGVEWHWDGYIYPSYRDGVWSFGESGENHTTWTSYSQYIPLFIYSICF